MAESVTIVFVQVIGPLLEAETIGVQTSDMTVVEALDVQPLLCVTVNVYVPDVVTEAEVVVAPLLHK